MLIVGSLFAMIALGGRLRRGSVSLNIFIITMSADSTGYREAIHDAHRQPRLLRGASRCPRDRLVDENIYRRQASTRQTGRYRVIYGSRADGGARALDGPHLLPNEQCPRHGHILAACATNGLVP